MRDLAIAINVGSPGSNISLFKMTIDSFSECLSGCDYCVFICIGSKISSDLREYIEKLNSNYPACYRIIHRGELSYAKFLNCCFEEAKEFRFFAQSHDDIKLISLQFWEKFILQYRQLSEPVGLISFLDIGYRLGDFSPSTRPGFHIDFIEHSSWYTGKIFQFHNFPEFWYVNQGKYAQFTDVINRLAVKTIRKPLIKYPKTGKFVNSFTIDLPIRPVKVHGAFNHFIIFTEQAREAIGRCDDWDTPNALLIDEDFSLTCTYNGLSNILLPGLEYFHYRSEYAAGGETRSWRDIGSHKNRVENLFINKWGFPSRIKTRKELDAVIKKSNFKELFWSSEKNSYDWFYL